MEFPEKNVPCMRMRRVSGRLPFTQIWPAQEQKWRMTTEDARPLRSRDTTCAKRRLWPASITWTARTHVKVTIVMLSEWWKRFNATLARPQSIQKAIWSASEIQIAFTFLSKYFKSDLDDTQLILCRGTSLIDCPIGFDYCSTEMIADWYALGNQQVKISRGCSKEAHPEECSQGQSDRIRVKPTVFGIYLTFLLSTRTVSTIAKWWDATLD